MTERRKLGNALALSLVIVTHSSVTDHVPSSRRVSERPETGSVCLLLLCVECTCTAACFSCVRTNDFTHTHTQPENVYT